MVRELRFEWDARKARDNLRKHAVSFEEAQSAFLDEQALLIGDPEHSEAEARFILLGLSARVRVVLVCHRYRANDAVIRIISARRATRREREQYFERCSP